MILQDYIRIKYCCLWCLLHIKHEAGVHRYQVNLEEVGGSRHTSFSIRNIHLRQVMLAGDIEF